MGKQSSRIYYQGKDHKDIYMNGYYHSAVYLCKESADGKVKCELVWRKIFEENLYIHQTLRNTDSLPDKWGSSLTVDMDAKKAYLSRSNTFREGNQGFIVYNPDWVDGKKYATFLGGALGGNSTLYVNEELIFNNIFKLNFQLGLGRKINKAKYPAIFYINNSAKLLTIRKAIIEKDEVISETISRNLPYTVSNFEGYNGSQYIYMLAKLGEDCLLMQYDIDGNAKTLKLGEFNVFTTILAVKDEKVYIMQTKALKDENTGINFIINSITVVDGMEIVSTEEVDSWNDTTGSIVGGRLAARIYTPTISPLTFIYSRYSVTAQHAKSLLITIDENEISTGDINIDNFSFFVNLYEDGKIVDTITVSTKYDCTDMKNGIIWLFELSSHFVTNVTTAGEDIKTEGFSSTIHYTKEGWVEGGIHGVFSDKETQYFYTFYIKHLYPSGENFFIRFKAEED